MELLPAFIRFLEDSRLLSRHDLQFETGLKVQKYAYLSGRFGLDLGCDYSMYRYGPYSPGLADAHYELAEDPEHAARDDAVLPSGFDREGFLRLVGGRSDGWLEVAATCVKRSAAGAWCLGGRSDGWLEVAATLAYLRGRFAEDRKLVAHVESIKCNYTAGFIGTVLRELQVQRVL